MKRALVVILSLALIMCLAIPALAAEDVVIYDFSDAKDAEDNLGYNVGLAGMGFSTPVVTVEDGHVKMQFTGNAQTNAAIGGYLSAPGREWVADLAEQAADYKYIRMYVENNTPNAFPFTFLFKDETQKIGGSPDMTKAVLINTAGEKVTVTALNTNDNPNGYIELPSGFKGWLFMDTDLSSFSTGPKGYNMTALTEWSQLAVIEWDLRSVGDVTEGNNYMIWDDLALVNEAVAPDATDPGTDEPATDDPNQGGDVSMLLYAAAAVSGLGALAIRRKK